MALKSSRDSITLQTLLIILCGLIMQAIPRTEGVGALLGLSGASFIMAGSILFFLSILPEDFLRLHKETPREKIIYGSKWFGLGLAFFLAGEITETLLLSLFGLFFLGLAIFYLHLVYLNSGGRR